jgi:hypothetical protein
MTEAFGHLTKVLSIPESAEISPGCLRKTTKQNEFCRMYEVHRQFYSNSVLQPLALAESRKAKSGGWRDISPTC